MDYWLITTGPDDQPGINGAIMRREQPAVITVNTVDVPSADDFAAKVTANGGKVLTPKMAVPGVGYFHYCQDTEGNVFVIMEADQSAQ